MKKKLHKTYKIQTLSIVLIVIGVFSIILSVLSTSYMQIKHLEVFREAHSNAMDYLFDAPLIYIIIIAVILIIAGIGIIIKENIHNSDKS